MVHTKYNSISLTASAAIVTTHFKSGASSSLSTCTLQQNELIGNYFETSMNS